MATTIKQAGAVGSVQSLTPILITSLPEHILIDIFEYDSISRVDLVALRETCTVLSNAATPVLFRRIRISQLHRDRDSFLAICRSPHLAQHVRELDWQEVSWFPGYFDRVGGARLLPGCAGDDTSEMCGKLDAIAADLFWLPTVPGNRPKPDRDAAESHYHHIVVQFRDEFHSALSRLPNLHTILSRPMPPDRILSWCEYPIEAKLLQSHHFDGVRPESMSIAYSNNGLFDFILPALEAAAPKVTRLLWEDERAGSVRQSYPAAFQRLKTLSIYLIPHFHEHRQLDGLAALLGTATNVRDLSLGLSTYAPDNFLLTMLRFSLTEQHTHWSGLRSLNIISMPIMNKYLFSIVESNAATLRHLCLTDCCISLATAASLGRIRGIHLLSLRINEERRNIEPSWIIYEPRDIEMLWIKEVDLLYCINNGAAIYDYSESELPPEEILLATVHGDNLSEEPSDDYSDASSEDSLDRRLNTASSWLWHPPYPGIHGDIFRFRDSSCGYDLDMEIH